MVRSVRHSPNRMGLSALVAILLLLAGCDVLGFGVAEPATPAFEMTNDLAARTAVLSGASNGSSSGEEDAAPALSLTPVVRVRPPTVEKTRTQAGHLSYDSETERLHVGYKLAGPAFGGAVDVLGVQREASGGGLVEGRRSLRSHNVDVVEVQYDSDEGALYAAGAVTTQKRRVSPAVISKIVPGNDAVEARSKRLSHNVAKSVLLGAAPNTVYVATDENALFQFDLNLNNQSKRTVGGTSGFRSAAAHEGQVFVLDESGRVFETDASAFSNLSEVVRLTDTDFGNGTVARLHADADRLYAALNEKGFALFSPPGDAVWTSGSVPPPSRYTCVSAGAEYLYVGRFDGVIEVYRKPDTVPNDGLERVGTFGPWGSTYGGGLSGAPINQIVEIDGHLYLANSRDGMVVVRIDGETSTG